MVLYHAITTFHILEFIVHRLAYNKENKSVLALPEFIYEKPGLVDRLYKYKIFDDIRKIRYRKVSKSDKNEIIINMDGIVKLAFPDLDEFDEINIAGAQYYFGMWCAERGKHFNLFEEATGVITDPEALRRSVVGINPLQDEIADEYGMYCGDNEMIDKIYCNLDAQNKALIDDKKMNKIVDFQIVKETRALDNKAKKKVYSFFEVPSKIEVTEDSYLMITQHFHNLNLMTFEQQASLYQLTIDYFIPDKKIVYKPHPDDLHNYKTLTPNAEIINVKAPIELIVSAFEKIPYGAATIGSTAIRNIGTSFSSVLRFNDNYATCYSKVHIYHLFCKMAAQVDKECRKIYAVGVNKPLLENMINFVVKDLSSTAICYCDSVNDIEKTSICDAVIIDRIADSSQDIKKFLENIDEGCMVFFTNYDEKDFTLFEVGDFSCDSDIFHNIVAKRIIISPVSDAEYVYTELGEQVVYIYIANKNIYKEIQSMSFEKVLNNSKVTTRIPEDADKDTQIAILKGMLEATEKRLHYYMKREKELLAMVEDKG